MRPEVAAQLEQLSHSARRARDRLADAQRQAGQAQAVAATPDHLITVTMAAGAGLTGLTIHPRALQQYDSARLAATILAVVNEATARLRDLVTEPYRAALGDDLDPDALVEGPAAATEAVARMARKLHES